MVQGALIPIELLIGYSLILFLSIPSGLLFTRALFPTLMRITKIVPCILVSLVFGLPVAVSILWVVAQFTISAFTIGVIASSISIISLVIIVKLPSPKMLPEPASPRTVIVENLFFTILMMFSLGYFALTALYLGWPQVGDPWRLGAIVSLILEHGHLPTTYAPMSSNPMSSPLGFPVLCAAVSLVSGCLPAESLLIVASFAISWIPLVIAWLVYSRTESKLFASLAFLLNFYLHPIISAKYCLFYFYLNGTYTVIFAILIAFASIVVPVVVKSTDSPPPIAIFLVFILAGFTCFITYPSFALIPLLGLLFWLKNAVGRKESTSIRKLILKAGPIAIVFGVALVFAHVNGYFQFIYNILGRDERLTGFHIGEGYFTVGMIGVFMAVAVITALLGLVRNSNRVHNSVFLILAVLTLLSVNDWLYLAGLNFLLPSRMVIFLTICSFQYVAFAAHVVQEKACQVRHLMPTSNKVSLLLPAKIRTMINCSVCMKAIAAFLILVIMVPSLTSTLQFQVTEEKSWFVRSEVFNDDLMGMLYIRENVSKHDLVLNYQSFSDLFLPSIGVLNVVFDYQCDRNRAFVLHRIWEDPSNETLVRNLLEEYNVSYVFLSSVYSVLDVVNRTPGARGRPLPLSEYLLAFGSYDFLGQVFIQGRCAVYKVNKGIL